MLRIFAVLLLLASPALCQQDFPPGGTTSPIPSGTRVLWWDFTGTTGTHFGTGAIGGGDQAQIAESVSRPGVVQIGNNSNANGGVYWQVGSETFLIAGGEAFTLVFRVDASTDVVGHFGFQDAFTAAEPVDGVYINLDGTTLDGMTASNSTRSTTSSSYTISEDTWYTARVTVNAGGTTASFSLTNSVGTLLWSDTLDTNLPTGAGRNTGAGATAYKTLAADADFLSYDYVEASSPTLSARGAGSGVGVNFASVWGSITGALANQIDLSTVLDAKSDFTTGTAYPSASCEAGEEFYRTDDGTRYTCVDTDTWRTVPVDELNVKDYGAVGDGSTDDTVAIQAALDAVAAAHSSLYFPKGVYKITDTLEVVQANNFRVRGPNYQGETWSTYIRWDGAASGTMLLLDGVRESEWMDIGLDGRIGANEAGVIIDIDKITAGTGQPRKNLFRRMLIRGGLTATVRIANTSTVNNEAHVFEDCAVSGATVKGDGFQVKNINAKNNQVVRGKIGGYVNAVNIIAGSLHMRGTELSGNDVWVRTETEGEPVYIDNCDGDSGKTFVEMTGNTQPSPVLAIGNRFVQYYDGDLFIFNNSNGPLVLIGNDFASGGYDAGTTTSITSTGPQVIALGNVFPNDTLLPYEPGTSPRLSSLFAQGNWQYIPGNQYRPFDNVNIPSPGSDTPFTPAAVGMTGLISPDTQSFAWDNNYILVRSSWTKIAATADVTLTQTPTIIVKIGTAGAFDGQMTTITHVGDTNTVTLQDEGTLAGSKLRLTASTIDIGPHDSVTFLYSSDLDGWVQIGPVVNVQ